MGLEQQSELEKLLFRTICKIEVLQEEIIKLTGKRYVFREELGSDMVHFDDEGYPSSQESGGDVGEGNQACKSSKT